MWNENITLFLGITGNSRMKLYIRLIIFTCNLLFICGCCPFNFDLQNLQGSYVTKDKKIIVIIYPEYIIWTSSEGYKLSKKYENRIVLQEGPCWSIGGNNLRMLTKNRLRAGNIIDGIATFYKIPETEAWDLLKSWGYDTEKIKNAPIFSHSHYQRGKKRGELLYDSSLERTKSR